MEPDDIVIYCDGNYFHVSEKEGKYIGRFVEQEEAEQAAKDWMEKSKYWSAVWFISDHGNVSPYKF